MKKMMVAVLVVTLLATAGVVMAQGWGRGPGYGPGAAGQGCGPGYGAQGPCGNNLNLSAEQQQQMQALREKFFAETGALREEMINKRVELQNLWAQPAPDQEKILLKQREMNGLKEQLQEKSTKNRLEMRKLLTPEQQAELSAYGPGFGPGGGKRGGFGRGAGFAGCPRW